MTLAELVKKSFSLWKNTLPSVLIFSFISALLNSWTYFFKLSPDSFHISTNMMLMGAAVGLINLIPNNAIFAKLGHAIHDQPITFTQALAVSLIKLPRTALWLVVILLLIYIPAYFVVSQNMIWVTIFIVYILFIITFGVYCVLVFPLMINGNHTLISAVKTSFELIKNQWWFTGLVMSVPVIFAILCQGLLKFLLGEIGLVIGTMLFLPLNTATITVLYEHHLLRIKSNA